MSARVVIGANFGDEGKGLITDYLANRGGDVVVRFNGGAQAGHTVVTPEGLRHVFSHFGSGSFVGLPTFLSRYFICNPVSFLLEAAESHGSPEVYADHRCLVTTPYDVEHNRELESGRSSRHGSCGLGIFATIKRHEVVPLSMADLWMGGDWLKRKMESICQHYEQENDDRHDFLRRCEVFASAVGHGELTNFNDPIFEGAQGLLLSQDNMAMYPYLTPSHCGLRNVRLLTWEAGVEIGDVFYVSRSYLTRHGVGPFPSEDPNLRYRDDTNADNEWQGPLRFGPLNVESLLKRIHSDCRTPKLALTHCDQFMPNAKADIYAFGRTRDSVTRGVKMLSA